MPTIWQVEIINKKEFTKIILNKNVNTYIIYILSLNFKIEIIIYLIQKVSIISKSFKEVFKNILAKYLDFVNVFFLKSQL